MWSKQCSTCVHLIEPKDRRLCLKCELTGEQTWRNTGTFCKLYKLKYRYTNADRIRDMTDEELEKWFTSVCTAKSTCSCMDCAFDAFMYCGFGDWLKQEAE